MELNQLISLLHLKRIDTDRFVGLSPDDAISPVYGGQVLAQAQMAAEMTVDPSRVIHSLHAYFLLPGNVEKPFVYEVDRIRDGFSFTTRRIIASQDDQIIFNMSASFQKPESGDEHQLEMPDVPGPENLLPDTELQKQFREQAPKKLKELFTRIRPIEIRRVDPINPLHPEKREPVNNIWLRAAGSVGDNQAMHRAVLSYASDYTLLSTAMLPHGYSFFNKKFKPASLDHAMWFHRDVKADEWLLYAQDSPSTSGSRGFCRGMFFTQDGKLVATAAQEGLLRIYP